MKPDEIINLCTVSQITTELPNIWIPLICVMLSIASMDSWLLFEKVLESPSHHTMQQWGVSVWNTTWGLSPLCADFCLQPWWPVDLNNRLYRYILWRSIYFALQFSSNEYCFREISRFMMNLGLIMIEWINIHRIASFKCKLRSSSTSSCEL